MTMTPSDTRRYRQDGFGAAPETPPEDEGLTKASAPSYQQTYSDRQYLWKTYGQANDMGGGYVESEDLEHLLEFPNKAMARRCLHNMICYWFQVGPEDHQMVRPIPWHDPKVREIAQRHGVVIDSP